jgi:signal transduction histidine kinase
VAPLPLPSNAGAARYDELLRAYTGLQEDNVRLRQEQQRRTVALASAAHELKTPLSIMCGYLELLLKEKLGPLSDRQRQVLGAMQANGSRLQQFVKDFLTYSGLETGNLTAQFEVGDLNTCLLEVYGIWLARFQEKGVALYFPINERLPQFAFDYHKVQRVVSNLLENAYNCTPAGGTVWVTAEPYAWDRRMRQAAAIGMERRCAFSNEANSVRVTVCDTGPGIAPEYHQEIFEDFVSLAENHGSGLGLAIARRLVQAQLGTIWVESEVGAGSRFCFLLPLHPF